MSAKTSGGFTLLEIIIVLIVISIAAGVVTISMGNRVAVAGLNRDADALKNILAYGSDYSLIHQQALGVMVSPSGYRLMAFDERRQDWQSMAARAEEILLDDDIRLNVESAAAAEATGHLYGEQAAILLYPDGRISPFTLTLAYENNDSVALKMVLENDGIIRTQKISDGER